MAYSFTVLVVFKNGKYIIGLIFFGSHLINAPFSPIILHALL